MQKIEEFKVGNYLVSIYPDENCINPRKDMDFLGKLCLLHRRYNLWNDTTYKEDDFSRWDEWEDALQKEYEAVIILPVYMYDHSGITIKTTPFSCRWDSGQIGFTFITKKDFLKEYKEVNLETIARAEKLLIAELEIYDQYLQGYIYGYVIEKDGDHVDSCWGFYGLDCCKQEAGLMANSLWERDLKGPEFDYSI